MRTGTGGGAASPAAAPPGGAPVTQQTRPPDHGDAAPQPGRPFRRPQPLRQWINRRPFPEVPAQRTAGPARAEPPGEPPGEPSDAWFVYLAATDDATWSPE